MTTPTVIETRLRLEPVTRDSFGDPPGASSGHAGEGMISTFDIVRVIDRS